MDSDIFYEPYLKFKVIKPSYWNFIPPAWSPISQLKNSLEENEEHWLKFANKPFCVAMRYHNSRRHVYPTFQATVRYSANPGNNLAKDLLKTQLLFLANEFSEFEIIESTTEAIISGYQTNIVRATYVLPFEIEGELILASVMSWNYQIFVKQRTFTIGISSPKEDGYLNEDELKSIIESIRIGI